mgnify:CR=1 FL=1
MRFVPSHCITAGMKLGDPLYNDRGDLMLSKGQILTDEYISAIHRLQYNGIYIDDDLSKDLEIINVINDKVRSQTIKTIKNTFIQFEQHDPERKPSDSIRKNMEQMKRQVQSIVDEICKKKDVMVNMIDMKVFDDYTYFHSVNVAVLSIVLGVAMDLERKDLNNLGFSALLHDIGKVFVRKDLLNKTEKLTFEEFEELKMHSKLGYGYIKSGMGVSNIVHMGILDHHEKYGGGGYPNNLNGDRISLFGRIIAVADVYDALTSDRPYRKAILPSNAVEYIMGSVVTRFDPEVVKVFVRKIAPYPIGTCVKLSNGSKGIVIDNYEEFPMRPRLRIYEEKGKVLKEPYELMLADKNRLNITVVEIV